MIMYFMQRLTAFWLFDTAEEMWENRAVERRIRMPNMPDRKPSPKTFDEFRDRLDAGEEVILGYNLVVMWRCFSCKPKEECEWHINERRTFEDTIKFYMMARDMGGMILDDNGAMYHPSIFLGE